MTYAEILASRGYNINTREGRAYVALAAQAVRVGEEDAAAVRATLAADVPMRKWCAWHALTAVAGNLEQCPCAVCKGDVARRNGSS